MKTAVHGHGRIRTLDQDNHFEVDEWTGYWLWSIVYGPHGRIWTTDHKNLLSADGRTDFRFISYKLSCEGFAFGEVEVEESEDEENEMEVENGEAENQMEDDAPAEVTCKI